MLPVNLTTYHHHGRLLISSRYRLPDSFRRRVFRIDHNLRYTSAVGVPGNAGGCWKIRSVASPSDIQNTWCLLVVVLNRRISHISPRGAALCKRLVVQVRTDQVGPFQNAYGLANMTICGVSKGLMLERVENQQTG